MLTYLCADVFLYHISTSVHQHISTSALTDMKNNYNIKINNNEPSSEQIAKHKDFDALLKAHAGTTPPPKAVAGMGKIVKMGIGALITGAAALVMLFFAPGLLRNNTGDDIVERKVSPPIPQAQKVFASYKVNANQGGVYEYGNGSKITVPARAFVYEDGSEVTGEVDLKYREFHDFVDFFLSGIPMEYDSAGQEFQLESAGMMEIYAEQNGRPLRINSDKDIDVQLASEIQVDGNESAYNLYQFENQPPQNEAKAVAANWSYKGKSKLDILPEEETQENTESEELAQIKKLERNINREEKQLLQAAEQEIASVTPEIPKPKAPKKPNPNGYIFDFDVNKERFPELAAYENVLWQVIEGQPFDENYYNINWEDVQIRKANDDVYSVALVKGEQRVNLNVTPVLSGKDYRKAQAEFDQKMAVYTQGYAQRQAEVAEKQAAVRRKMAAKRAELEAQKADAEARIADLKRQGRRGEATSMLVTRKVMNNFEIRDFGIWNIDRPLPPYEQILVGNFCDESEKTYKGNPVYIVNKTNNTVGRFHATSRNQFRINTKAENLMWLVTDDGKLAIFSPEQFNNLIPQKQHTFAMATMPQTVDNEEDVRRILKL